MRIPAFALILCFQALRSFSQQSEIDSLKNEISKGRKDTLTVIAIRKLAGDYYYSFPDSDYYFAWEGLQLAREIHFKKGEAMTLGCLGLSLTQTGNYPRALEYLLRSLKISEDINYQDGYVIALQSLSAFYSAQKDPLKSIEYGYQAIRAARTEQDSINSIANMGGEFGALGKFDSALYFINLAYEKYMKRDDKLSISFSQINLAEIYVKMGMDKLALEYYRLALPVVTSNNISEALCEINFYLGTIFERLNQTDSAIYYGQQSFAISSRFKYTSRQLKACNFLSSFYERRNAPDSVLKYIRTSIIIKDSLFDQEKQRLVQNMTYGENIRQQEIVLQNKQKRENHIRNLQLLGIGAFIPVFFLIILLLSRIKVKPRVVEFLGVIGLLLFFEFITDLIYPYVSELTNERPIWEMSILVAVAIILEPLNYKLEHWVKKYLVHKPLQNITPVVANFPDNPEGGIDLD